MKKPNLTVLLVILMVIVFLVGYGQNLKKQSQDGTVDLCQDKTLQIIEAKDILPLGDSNAPLLIEVYSDYQCPFCANYFVETIAPIIDEYVNTGRARLIYQDLAFEGERSQWASEAAHCANDQEKFWEYHQAIISERYTSGKTDVYKKDSLKKIAKEIGLDECEFNICFDSEKYTQIVKDATKVGFEERGIDGTPTTLFNGEMVTNDEGKNLGAMSYDMLKEKINGTL